MTAINHPAVAKEEGVGLLPWQAAMLAEFIHDKDVFGVATANRRVLGQKEKFYRPKISKIIGEGADAIEKHGWKRGTFGAPGFGFCVIGAVRYAHHVQVMSSQGTDSAERYLHRRARERFGTSDVMKLNDRHKWGMFTRTNQKRVVQFMRDCQRELEEKNL